jgi:hypothetical protein
MAKILSRAGRSARADGFDPEWFGIAPVDRSGLRATTAHSGSSLRTPAFGGNSQPSLRAHGAAIGTL